jgi:polar amino acid transport system permease protein/octopine/nopaline transport system permease protein
MDESLAFIISIFPRLLAAVPLTLGLTLISGVIGNLLAVPVALARLSPNPLLWVPSAIYILLMRGTPLLVQTYLIYYGLGEVLPGSFIQKTFLWPYLKDGFWYAVFAFSLNTAGYTGEILRGAMSAVPKGEIEAAIAYGMSPWLRLRRVILPRAIQICLPAMSGETILLLKATSLASLITVWDIMGTARQIQKETYQIYEPLLAAGIIYIVTVFILTRLLNVLERRINQHRAAPVSA